jgi:hypothetical protein
MRDPDGRESILLPPMQWRAGAGGELAEASLRLSLIFKAYAPLIFLSVFINLCIYLVYFLCASDLNIVDGFPF